MRGDGEVGLGGMVVMVGAPDITAEAGMCVLSWSVLGLDGSSEDRKKRNYVTRQENTEHLKLELTLC